MTLDDWDQRVSRHLQFIEAGASMCARHAERLSIQPPFETRAEEDLQRARQVLETALAKIVAAQETYNAKPVEA